jgi:hypothetical protein
MVKLHLEYIKVKRDTRSYKVYLKDLRNVIRHSKKDRPPVPNFEEKQFSEISDHLTTGARDSIGSDMSGFSTLDLEDLMEFEPFIVSI